MLAQLKALARNELAKRERMKAQKADAEQDLLAFVRMMWPVMEPTVSMQEGWILDLLCDVMMAVTDGHMTKVIINVPPGSMKSSLLNVLWPAWEWGPQNMPHMRYLSISYSTSVPERDNIRFARVIQHPTYRKCWGDRFTVTRVNASVHGRLAGLRSECDLGRGGIVPGPTGGVQRFGTP